MGGNVEKSWSSGAVLYSPSKNPQSQAMFGEIQTCILLSGKGKRSLLAAASSGAPVNLTPNPITSHLRDRERECVWPRAPAPGPDPAPRAFFYKVGVNMYFVRDHSWLGGCMGLWGG